MGRRFAPLSGTFMIASIIGFFISVFILWRIEGCASCPTWAFTFAILFAVMFLASIVSMTHAPSEAELMLDEEAKRIWREIKKEDLHKDIKPAEAKPGPSKKLKAKPGKTDVRKAEARKARSGKARSRKAKAGKSSSKKKK
ncbi:hypothetical protein JW968_06255 [Candidatus Woesearchaeota archaeon]|nr:hypothetical protein [Candidatus Woesearchaeota archaeon]